MVKTIVLALSIFVLQSLLNILIELNNISWVEPPAEQNQSKNPKLVQVFSFGQISPVIDAIWMAVLGDAGLGPFPGPHPAIYYNLELLTKLDPAFFNVYFVGSNLLTVVRRDIKGAGQILNSGIEFLNQNLNTYPVVFRERYWKRAWQLYILKAYLEVFEFEDIGKAENSFSLAASYPDAPAYTRHLKQKLAAWGGKYEVGLGLLEFMLSGLLRSKDPKSVLLRESLELKKFNLQVARYLFYLNSDFKKYRALHQGQSLRSILDKFKKSKGIFKDPWGGSLFLNKMDDISTTTPYERVFNLD